MLHYARIRPQNQRQHHNPGQDHESRLNRGKKCPGRLNLGSWEKPPSRAENNQLVKPHRTQHKKCGRPQDSCRELSPSLRPQQPRGHHACASSQKENDDLSSQRGSNTAPLEKPQAEMPNPVRLTHKLVRRIVPLGTHVAIAAHTANQAALAGMCKLKSIKLCTSSPQHPTAAPSWIRDTGFGTRDSGLGAGGRESEVRGPKPEVRKAGRATED